MPARRTRWLGHTPYTNMALLSKWVNIRLRIGEHVLSHQAAVAQALAQHFRDFYRRGPPNRWRWLATGASVLTLCQQQQLTTPFSEDEVIAVVRGLNNEGAPGPDGIPMFFYKDCWDTKGHSGTRGHGGSGGL